MPVIKLINEGRVPVKIYTDDVDSAAFDQLKQVAELPFIHSHVAAMPDVHAGIGAAVGSVIPTKGAIIPAAVGVDIGCGMNALKLSLHANDLPDKLTQTRRAIEHAVPVGFDMHENPSAKRTTLVPLWQRLTQITDKHRGIQKMQKRFDTTWARQIGTLGGGNHFIELCLDEADQVWIMLHSGSRGIGNCIGRYFISLAKKDMDRHITQLPHKDLAYFKEGSEYFDDYVEAVEWAQDYALVNRKEIMRLITRALQNVLGRFKATEEAVNCHHNYVAQEYHFGEQVFITRKGAIRAGRGELGIIPGNMGACSYIIRGKGAADSFSSCAHGAGRRMSRAQAKREFSVDDMIEQTRGVECRKDKSVLDEIPGAYKDIDTVMHNQKDLVDVVHTLKQVVCIKG